MISTIIRVGWLSLRRSPIELALVFAVPVAFFSIFAMIFGDTRSATSKVDVAIVDEARSDLSRRVIAGFAKEAGLDVVTTKAGAATPLDRAAAEALVREGKVAAAIVLPDHFSFGFGPDAKTSSVDVLIDSSDPVAPQIVSGLFQKVLMTSAPDILASSGLEQLEKWGGALTAEQKAAVDTWKPMLEKSMSNQGEGEDGSKAGGFDGLVSLRQIDVLGKEKKNPVVAFYAAAIAVMFLLFSTSGGGGVILEEEESGTLERLLVSGVPMQTLLLGKWLFLSIMGAAQITVMFLWGSAVFGLELFSHIPGFVLMTTATSAAAAGFGLVLATMSKSRAQLSGISTIVILMMSALGGSMFPRIFMSETMQKIGLVTFNAWAIDGYQKVFWREAPLLDLWPQIGVLAGLTVGFMAAARGLSRRWAPN